MSSTEPIEGESSEHHSFSNLPSNNDRDRTLTVMYFNARSLLPKLDELRMLAVDSNPDIICIVETWLSQDITNEEVSIPGYLLHRKDRNRNGGGVLMYTRDSLNVKILSQPPDLEVLTLSLYSNNHRICIALFYRPPSSSAEVFDQVCSYFDTICVAQFSNFIFLGDFNVNIRDPSHPYYEKLCVVLCPYIPCHKLWMSPLTYTTMEPSLPLILC